MKWLSPAFHVLYKKVYQIIRNAVNPLKILGS